MIPLSRNNCETLKCSDVVLCCTKREIKDNFVALGRPSRNCGIDKPLVRPRHFALFHQTKTFSINWVNPGVAATYVKCLRPLD